MLNNKLICVILISSFSKFCSLKCLQFKVTFIQNKHLSSFPYVPLVSVNFLLSLFELIQGFLFVYLFVFLSSLLPSFFPRMNKLVNFVILCIFFPSFIRAPTFTPQSFFFSIVILCTILVGSYRAGMQYIQISELLAEKLFSYKFLCIKKFSTETTLSVFS